MYICIPANVVYVVHVIWKDQVRVLEHGLGDGYALSNLVLCAVLAAGHADRDS